MTIWTLLFEWKVGEQKEYTYFERTSKYIEQFVVAMEKSGAKLIEWKRMEKNQ